MTVSPAFPEDAAQADSEKARSRRRLRIRMLLDIVSMLSKRVGECAMPWWKCSGRRTARYTNEPT
jgi:hypothetical protein